MSLLSRSIKLQCTAIHARVHIKVHFNHFRFMSIDSHTKQDGQSAKTEIEPYMLAKRYHGLEKNIW